MLATSFQLNRCCKAIGLVIPELNGKFIELLREFNNHRFYNNLIKVAKKVAVLDEVNAAAMKAAATESFGYNTADCIQRYR